MDAEEYPQGLGRLRTGPDPSEPVMLLVVAEAALKAAGPFLGDRGGHFLPLRLVLAGPPLLPEVGADTVFGGEGPVGVVGVDGVAPGNLKPCAGKPLHCEDGPLEPYALVEGVEGKVLDEADAADLELVHLGPELHRLFLLSPHYRPDIGPVKAHYAPLGAYAVVEQGMLLPVGLFGRGPAHVLVGGEGDPVLLFHSVEFRGELLDKQ